MPSVHVKGPTQSLSSTHGAPVLSHVGSPQEVGSDGLQDSKGDVLQISGPGMQMRPDGTQVPWSGAQAPVAVSQAPVLQVPGSMGSQRPPPVMPASGVVVERVTLRYASASVFHTPL